MAALVAALAEIERYVTKAGWDQPARLFSLVDTANLVAAEPSLASQMNLDIPGSLSSIEQEGFHDGEDLLTALAAIYWPPTVDGCAVAVERSFLPMEYEDQLPTDELAAAKFVANHPQRQDVRIVVGVLRTGESHGLARLVNDPDELLGSDDLVPGLTAALFSTFDNN